MSQTAVWIHSLMTCQETSEPAQKNKPLANEVSDSLEATAIFSISFNIMTFVNNNVCEQKQQCCYTKVGIYVVRSSWYVKR